MDVPKPTVRVCDCPNGCVVVTFGYVSFKFDREGYFGFVRELVRAAAALDRSTAHAEH